MQAGNSFQNLDILHQVTSRYPFSHQCSGTVGDVGLEIAYSICLAKISNIEYDVG